METSRFGISTALEDGEGITGRELRLIIRIREVSALAPKPGSGTGAILGGRKEVKAILLLLIGIAALRGMPRISLAAPFSFTRKFALQE